MATNSRLLTVLLPLLKNHSPDFQITILDEAIDFIHELQKIGVVRGFAKWKCNQAVFIVHE